MTVKRDRYRVAFIDPTTGPDIQEHEVEVWGVDVLRGEQESRRQGLKFSVVDQQSKSIVDLGDVRGREANELWACCVRLGLYHDKAAAWRLEHYVGANKMTDAERDDMPDPEPVDPTQPGASTD